MRNNQKDSEIDRERERDSSIRKIPVSYDLSAILAELRRRLYDFCDSFAAMISAFSLGSLSSR